MKFDFYKHNALSLYIHYPFCVRKCPYCDFNSYAKGNDEIRDELYFKVLKDDFKKWLPYINNRKFISVFIGGGTPSLCNPKCYADFLEFVSKYLSSECEITIEANPGTIDAQKIAALKAAGINRISLGVQSFNDQSLKRLGRIHDSKCARDACQLITKGGFDAFNIDLMHGLPGQDVKASLYDINTAVDLGCTHLSWYELTIEEDTYFGKHVPLLPDEETLFSIEQEGFNLLKSLGFERYEVSAFTKCDHCVHNENYWHFGDYVGIGAGAHGKVLYAGDTLRRVCASNPKDYLNGSFGEFYKVPKEEIAFEYMLNRLRLFNDIKSYEYAMHTGLSFMEIKPILQKACQKSLIQFKDDVSYCVTDLGHVMLNDVLEMFLP